VKQKLPPIASVRTSMHCRRHTSFRPLPTRQTLHHCVVISELVWMVSHNGWVPIVCSWMLERRSSCGVCLHDVVNIYRQTSWLSSQPQSLQ